MDRSASSRTTTRASADAVNTAMDAALIAARRGVRGANPLVGAAVLGADGTLVTGYHRGAGTPHAEVDAVNAAHAAGIDLTTALVCVTLEPCNHHGRTAPCTDLLIEAGVPEVAIAVADPNPAAAGGAARLRNTGTTVITAVRETEAKALNERWLRAVGERRPYVTLKIAQSLDGRIAAADGTSQWITSPASRARVHALRARVDAVVVGTGTAHADDPRLTARTTPEAAVSTQPRLADRQPVPVVLGMRDLNPASHLAGDPRTVHLRTRDPLAALQALRSQGIQHVLVEGGAQLAGAFVRADLVDELELHVAPVLLGDGLPGLADLGVTTLSEAIRWVPDETSEATTTTGTPETTAATGTAATTELTGTTELTATFSIAGTARPVRSNPDTILRLLPASSPSTPPSSAPQALVPSGLKPSAHTKDD